MVILTGVRWYLIVLLICIFLIIRMLSILSCPFWPSVCLLWKNVYLDLLIFWLGFFFFLSTLLNFVVNIYLGFTVNSGNKYEFRNSLLWLPCRRKWGNKVQVGVENTWKSKMEKGIGEEEVYETEGMEQERSQQGAKYRNVLIPLGYLFLSFLCHWSPLIPSLLFWQASVHHLHSSKSAPDINALLKSTSSTKALGLFPVLAIINVAAMNIVIHVFQSIQIRIFDGWIPVVK